MTEPVDLALNNTAGYYDISIAASGDFALEFGLDTSLTVAFFAERRADASEVTLPEKRRGWWGNLFSEIDDFEIGSKVWLLDQARRTQLILNNANDYVLQAYQWLIDQNYAVRLESDAEFTTEGIRVTLTIYRSNDIIDKKVFDLWENTGD